ncbi:hypothetical protein L596_023578 [Steinernema carpocapsae]|uniref:Uncharacterized protein n=1 Tax=Steinernema carpocapsae TaxID=34508 RepID=A0A4U5MEV0_STECR|nr:hypothetical protein L596_023578 [Steinernema carpocapsae]
MQKKEEGTRFQEGSAEGGQKAAEGERDRHANRGEESRPRGAAACGAEENRSRGGLGSGFFVHSTRQKSSWPLAGRIVSSAWPFQHKRKEGCDYWCNAAPRRQQRNDVQTPEEHHPGRGEIDRRWN